jgi:hypothetical protein
METIRKQSIDKINFSPLIVILGFLFFSGSASGQKNSWHYEYDVFSTDGSKKVFGPHFSIKIRKNMEWMDGERAHIIKKFYDTTDAYIPTLVIQSRVADETTPMKQLLRELSPKSMEFIMLKDGLKIDQCEAGYVEHYMVLDAESSPEMLDVRRFVRTYAIRHKNGAIYLMFAISKYENNVEKFSEDDLKYYRKYFHEMAISTIVTSRWKKDN